MSTPTRSAPAPTPLAGAALTDATGRCRKDQRLQATLHPSPQGYRQNRRRSSAASSAGTRIRSERCSGRRREEEGLSHASAAGVPSQHQPGRTSASARQVVIPVAGALPERLCRQMREVGESLMTAGEHRAASSVFRYLLVERPQELVFWFLLARCHEHLGQNATAQKLYAVASTQGGSEVFAPLMKATAGGKERPDE